MYKVYNVQTGEVLFHSENYRLACRIAESKRKAWERKHGKECTYIGVLCPKTNRFMSEVY